MPFKVVLIFFVLSAALLTPWARAIPGYAKIESGVIWIYLVCGFFGLLVLFTILAQIRASLSKPLEEWRNARAMDAKLRSLEDDEESILRPYVTEGQARQYIEEEASSGLIGLTQKGILTPAGEITGNWLDRFAFDLTPAASKSLRKKSIRQRFTENASDR